MKMQILGDVTGYTLQALFDEARLLMGQEQALQYRLAAVLRELDERTHVDGTPMRLPRWLHDHFGLTFGTAREKVRTARALGALPLIDTAFRTGELSYSKVRALTRVATPDNEEELLAAAQYTSAEGVEQLVRQVKQSACISDVQAMINSRSVSTRWDESGALIVQGRLTPEQGEVFLKALAKATEALARSATELESANHPGEGKSTDQNSDQNSDHNPDHNPDQNEDRYWSLRADALTQIMADSLAGREGSAPGDRHQVVVQVAAETLAASANAPKDVPAGTPFHPETIRRLACDGGLVTVLNRPDGEPLNVGRKTRAINTRALKSAPTKPVCTSSD